MIDLPMFVYKYNSTYMYVCADVCMHTRTCLYAKTCIYITTNTQHTLTTFVLYDYINDHRSKNSYYTSSYICK